MPRRPPRENFSDTLDRVLNLVDLYDELNPAPGRPAQEKADILRGALVLCAAALDALVLSAVIEAIPTAAKKGLLGGLAEKWIKDDPKEFIRVLSAADQDAALRDLARAQMSQITFQKAAAIEGILRDAVKADAPWAAAAAELGTTEDGVKESLDRSIERRNRIAHDGDLMPDSNRLRSVSRRYVRESAKLVLEVGFAVDDSVKKRIT